MEYITNLSLALQLNSLRKLGVSSGIVGQLKDLAMNRSVILRVNVEESCRFVVEVLL